MTIQEMFVAANEALRSVVERLPGDMYQTMLPVGMSTQPTNVENAIRYHTYDDAWVPDTLAGKTIKEVGETYEPILKSTEMLADFNKYSERASQAVAEFSDLTKTVHLSYGDFPAEEYLRHIICFRTFRAYDFSKLAGFPSPLQEDFAAALLKDLTPHIEGYRQIGIFPPAKTMPQNASAHDSLIALAGRD